MFRDVLLFDWGATCKVLETSCCKGCVQTLPLFRVGLACETMFECLPIPAHIEVKFIYGSRWPRALLSADHTNKNIAGYNFPTALYYE